MSTRRETLLPVIDIARCTGCGWCVAACPWQLLSLQRQGWRKNAVLHDVPPCTGCGLCARKCPFGVIDMAIAPQPWVPVACGSLDGQS